MPRRAKDTASDLFRITVSLPAEWAPYLDGIDRSSRSAALRRLVQFALNNGALQSLGYVAPATQPGVPYVPPPRPTVADLAAQRAADRAAVEALFGPDWDDQAPQPVNNAALAVAFDPQAPVGPMIWHDDEPGDLEP